MSGIDNHLKEPETSVGNPKRNTIKLNGNVWDSQTLATYWTISDVGPSRAWSTQLMKNEIKKTHSLYEITRFDSLSSHLYTLWLFGSNRLTKSAFNLVTMSWQFWDEIAQNER